jgi:hypothetical protein
MNPCRAEPGVHAARTTKGEKDRPHELPPIGLANERLSFSLSNHRSVLFQMPVGGTYCDPELRQADSAGSTYHK